MKFALNLVAGFLMIAAIHSQATAGPGTAAPEVTMLAGTAKTVITPSDDERKKLTTVMGTKMTRVDHDLYARALVLNDGKERLVIVTYDLNCLDVATPILRKRCRDELGIAPERLILLATHNHAAPIQIVPDNFEYGRWLAERIFKLIQEAMAKEAGPVRAWAGFGYGYFVRAVGNTPCDYEIQVLKVTRGDDVVALLFNHPTHPLQFSQDHIDTGHPGYAVDAVEEQLPGCQAMFADASGGNQFPDRGFIMYGNAEQVRSLGRELAAKTLEIARGPSMQDVTGPINSALEVVSLPLADPLSYEDAKRLAEKMKAPLDIGFVPYPHPNRGTNWIRALLRHHEQKIPFPKHTDDRVCTDDGFLVRQYDEPREFPCKYEEVIVARIGNMPFVAMQGEVCAPIGMRIKDSLRRKGPMMVFAYMGEHNLYIPTREIVRQDGYQAQVIRIQYASPVGWAPEVEDEMVSGVLAVVDKVMGNK